MHQDTTPRSADPGGSESFLAARAFVVATPAARSSEAESPLCELEAGLRKRLEIGLRHLSAQHDHLSEFYLLLAELIEDRDTARAQDVLRQLRRAWESHARLEDAVYFPALAPLQLTRAEREELLTLEEEHASIRGQMEVLSGLLADSVAAAAGEHFELLTSALLFHQAREERLLQQVIARRVG